MRICEYGENAPLWGGMNHKINGSYMLCSPQRTETRGAELTYIAGWSQDLEQI